MINISRRSLKCGISSSGWLDSCPKRIQVKTPPPTQKMKPSEDRIDRIWIQVKTPPPTQNMKQHHICITSNGTSTSIAYILYLEVFEKDRARKGCRWLKRMQELLGSDARNLSGRSSTCQNYKNKCTDQRSWNQGWNQEKLMMKARWQWSRRVISKINIQVGLEVFRWARRLV